MPSAIINTTGWSHSGAGSGVVSFNPSGGSGSSSKIYQHSSSGPVPLGSPSNLVSSAKNLREEKEIRDFQTGFNANNGASLDNYNDLFNSLLQTNSASKNENLQNARENAQLQYSMNAGLMRLQHALNENSAERVMRYNSIESEKNRQFQERLSNTAHQREIEDLQLAGLNPVLSGLGGQGAFTPAGSEAQGHNAQTGLGQVSSIPVDMTNNAQLLSSVFNTFIDNITKERIANKQISSNEIIEDAYNETLKDTTMIGSILSAGSKLLGAIVGSKALNDIAGSLWKKSQKKGGHSR